MAAREPFFLQANDYEAKQLRRLFAAVLGGSRFADVAPSITLTDEAHGVCGTTDLKVSEKSGTPNMSVDVAAGSTFIIGSRQSDQGSYWGENDAVTNVVIAAADATNPRKDLIVAKIRDAAYSGASNDLQITVEQGTPAASPADPTVPDDVIVLARVDVPALDTAITNSQITDLRVASSTWTKPRGRVGHAAVTSSQSSISALTDITSLSVAITGVAGRRYRVSIDVQATQVTSAGTSDIYITDGSNNVQQQRGFTGAASDNYPISYFVIVTPGAGAITYKGRAATSAGTLTLTGTATRPMTLLVEDIGGYLT